MKSFKQFIQVKPNPDDKDKWHIYRATEKIGHISRHRDNANKTYYKIHGHIEYEGQRTHPRLADAKKALNESIDQKANLWVKGYKTEEEARRTIRNIKDEVLYMLSDLKSIRIAAVDSQEKLQRMTNNQFSEWIINTFTNDLKKANWPESHSKELNDIIQKKIHKPLLADKRIL